MTKSSLRKLTPSVQASIVASIVAGATLEAACAQAGVTSRTHRNWMRQSPEYADAVEIAQRRRAHSLLAEIETKGRGEGDHTWKALAWIAERTVPELREHREVSLQVQRNLAELLDAVQEHMSPEAYAELVQALARAEGLATGEAGDG